MANKTQPKEVLYKLLEDTIGWIKHADTKSSILIGVILLLIGFTSHLFNVFDYLLVAESSFKYFVIVCLLVFYFALSLISLLLCFLSLIARVKLKQTKNYNKIQFFFGDFSKLSLTKFKTYLNNMSTNDINENLQEQIHINSIIAKKKMKYFNLSLCFTLFLFVDSLILLVISYII